MRALAKLDAATDSPAWSDFLDGAREVQAELQDWEQLLERQFGELEFFQAELERQAEATEAMQAQLAERQRQLEEERAATARLTHQLDQQDARLSDALAALAKLAADLKDERKAAGDQDEKLRAEFAARESAWLAERKELETQIAAASALAAAEPAASLELGDELKLQLAELIATELAAQRTAAQEREEALRAEFETREAAWRAERDDLRAQLAAAECTLPPTAAAAPVIDEKLQQQLTELQEERSVLEAELTLMRSRAADLQEQAAEHKRQLAERQNELTAELKQLRETLAAKPWASAAPVVAAPSEASLAATQPPPATLPAAPATPAEKEKAPDPLVNSVMAQFARLQKDVAQRRKQK